MNGLAPMRSSKESTESLRNLYNSGEQKGLDVKSISETTATTCKLKGLGKCLSNQKCPHDCQIPVCDDLNQRNLNFH
jgi:hypothetical protein